MIDCNAIMRSYSRYLLVIFNFFFVLTGIIVVSVGLSAKAYFNHFDELLNPKYFYVSDFLVLIGVLIFIIALCGCCGAMKENACLTSTFSTLLIMVFILEILAGTAGFVLRYKTEEFLDESLKKTMAVYGNDSEITATWDAVQEQMQCCGINNYTDWYTSLNVTLPISCCKIPAGTKNIFTCNAKSLTLYDEGCLERFGDYIRSNVYSVQIAGLTLATIQLLSIILSCFLSKQIRSDYETV